MNVTEVSLRPYIELFHSTLQETAAAFLPEHRGKLLHAALLPARITGYLSTQFGAGLEYRSADQTSIEIVRGSARVEDLFVRAPQRFRDGNTFFRLRYEHGGYLQSGGVFGMTLEGGFPFRLMNELSSFRFGDVRFKIDNWSRDVDYAEMFGDRSAAFWSPEQAVSRAKDEVLAALAEANQAAKRGIQLPEYISTFKERTVLLLGDYDEVGLARLRTLANLLNARGYDPILISDVPDQPVQDLPQKVSTIGFLARFVMVDDSSKSGHLMEVQLCKAHDWITVLLRKDGKGGSWMTAGASAMSKVILEQEYVADNPEPAVAAAVDWAGSKILELERKFNGLYPWRRQA